MAGCNKGIWGALDNHGQLTGNRSKAFTSEEACEIVMSLQQPAVFWNMASDWPALQWTLENLSCILDGKLIRFRLGSKKTETAFPQFENHCSFLEATLLQFLAWCRGQSDALLGPFSAYPLSEFWAYADYKYIDMLFEDKKEHFQDVVWSDFGFPGRDGKDSTLWIGTEGANTPCHLDCYGCNLVLQVEGRKRWHLFPPDDTPFLYPTRIPYEESSIFSKVNIPNPDFKIFPEFINARPHLVTLHPGQVLFVPRHWWHYVESLDPLTVSINSWIELDVDGEARVGEAITRATVCALKSAENLSNTDSWLNPTEIEATAHDVNLHYLNLAVQACLHKHKGGCSERPLHSDVSTNEHSFLSAAKKMKPNEDTISSVTNTEDDVKGDESRKFSIPFGDNLTPVLLAPQRPTLKGCETPVHNFKDSHHTWGSSVLCCNKSISNREHSASVESNRSPRDAPDPSTSTSSLEISTNDLLECLVHPDVITLVTQLLLKKHSC